jgi:hypothetical protein
MNFEICNNICDTDQLEPHIDSIGLWPILSFGEELTTHWDAIGNAYFSVSQPIKTNTPLLRHSHNFNQCIGILWISKSTQHQVAHICPGRWIHDKHGVELLEQNLWILRRHIELWKEAQILDGWIHIFWWREWDGYNQSSAILGDLLHSIFWYYPQVLALPSEDGEFQHIRTEREKIIHLRTKGIFKPGPKEIENQPNLSLFGRLIKYLN